LKAGKTFRLVAYAADNHADVSTQALSLQKGRSPSRHALIHKSVIPAWIAGIHDCTDAGGRATQEQLPRLQGRVELTVHGPGYPLPGGYDDICV
jgi:hypothetical protein